MSWVATGIVVSGYLGSQASKKAGQLQAESTQAGIGEQARQYDQSREDLMPWMNVGRQGLNTLADYLGLGGGNINGQQISQPVSPNQQDFMTTIPGKRTATPHPRGGADQWTTQPSTQQFDQAGWEAALAKYNQDLSNYQAQQQTGLAQKDGTFGSLLKDYVFEEDPGHQFGLAEGEKGINRGAAARGGWDSGATMKALLKYNQDYAGTKYNEGFNRDAANKGNKFSMLAGVSGMGQGATNQVSSLGANSANQISNLYTQGGNARAAGIVGGANAWNNAIGQGIGAYQNKQFMDWLQAPNSGGAASTWSR